MSEIEELRAKVAKLEAKIAEQKKQFAMFVAGGWGGMPTGISANHFGGLRATVAAGIRWLKQEKASSTTKRYQIAVLDGQLAVANAWHCFLGALMEGGSK